MVEVKNVEVVFALCYLYVFLPSSIYLVKYIIIFYRTVNKFLIDSGIQKWSNISHQSLKTLSMSSSTLTALKKSGPNFSAAALKEPKWTLNELWKTIFPLQWKISSEIENTPFLISSFSKHSRSFLRASKLKLSEKESQLVKLS